MNGFQIMAESYRKVAAEGSPEAEALEKKAHIYDFLSECDQEDLYNMIDSSAFNDIIREFFRLSLKNAGFDEEDRTRVLNELRFIFSEKTATEVCEMSN